MTPQPPADTDALIEEARGFVGSSLGYQFPTVAKIVDRLADALAREREAREEEGDALRQELHRLDETVVDLQQRAERAEAQVEALRTYIIYAPCPACGLPDPLRRAAACEQCAKAREALASLPPPQGERE